MTEESVRRAGFWRRFAATVLDTLIVLVPLQCLVVAGFALTDGVVQGGMVSTLTVCEPYNVPPALLAKLRPAPPEGSDSARHCSGSLFGFPTFAQLVVGKASRETTESGAIIEREQWVSYPMNARGQFIDAYRMDIPADIAFVVAILWQWAARGRTLGGRLLRLRIAWRAPDGSVVGPDLGEGIGWWAAIKRLLFSWLVGFAFVPGLLLVFGLYFLLSTLGQPGLAKIALFALIPIGIGQLVFLLMILTDIVQRRDPIYDRWAGTAAVVE